MFDLERPERQPGDHSHSSLERGAACLFALSLDRQGVPASGVPNEEARGIGTVVHEAMRRYVTESIAVGADVGAEQARVLARETFFDPEQTEMNADAWPEVEAMVMSGAVLCPVNMESILGAELFLTVPVGESYRFRARLDRMDLDSTERHATITDYKTEHRVVAEREVERSAQARRYAWVVARSYPDVRSCSLELANLRHGIIRTAYFPPGEFLELVDAVQLELEAAIAQVERRLQGVIEATPGAHCSWCDWFKDCPLRHEEESTLDTHGALVTGDDARHVAGRLITLDVERAHLTKLLSAWCVSNGAVTVGGKEYAHRKVSKLSYPVSAVRCALEAEGINPDPALKFDTKALTKLLLEEGTPELVQAVEGVAVDKSFTQFKARKAQGGDE